MSDPRGKKEDGLTVLIPAAPGVCGLPPRLRPAADANRAACRAAGGDNLPLARLRPLARWRAVHLAVQPDGSACPHDAVRLGSLRAAGRPPDRGAKICRTKRPGMRSGDRGRSRLPGAPTRTGNGHCTAEGVSLTGARCQYSTALGADPAGRNLVPGDAACERQWHPRLHQKPGSGDGHITLECRVPSATSLLCKGEASGWFSKEAGHALNRTPFAVSRRAARPAPR